MKNWSWGSVALWVGCVLLTACSDNAVKATTEKDLDDSSNSEPLFGIGTMTFGTEGTNDYLLLVPKIDQGGKQLKLDHAREFSGQSDLATLGGHVFVASGDEPAIVKYGVGADNSLTPSETVNFASYGLASAAFWNNQFVSTKKAYMVNGPTELIVWNPETMFIEGTVKLPKLEDRDGLKVVTGLADRASVVHEGKFYLPLYWTDDSYAERSADSVIAVIDVETNEFEKTISAGCPGLDYATVDDEGLLHFSNWTGGAGTHFVLGTAQNCIFTLNPQSGKSTIRTFASLTGGHEGAAFKYVGGGRFVFSVFDEVRADIENAEDPFTPVGGLNWQLYSYESKTGEVAPVPGVDWNSGAIIHSEVAGKFYSMVPGADYATTTVYSLGSTEATPSFGITGWSFRLFQIR